MQGACGHLLPFASGSCSSLANSTSPSLERKITGFHEQPNYLINQDKLKIIKSWPFIYWISDEFRENFKSDSVKDVMKNCQGLATADNNRFLRFWWELASKDKLENCNGWVRYAKGGPYKKWSGNLWLLVNWKSNGSEIRDFKDGSGKQRSRTQNEEVYFREGITYSASGSKGPSYRLLPKGCIFDVGGSSIFPIKKYRNTKYILAFFNSSISNYVIDCLNPTVNKQVGDIERVPFAIPNAEQERTVEYLSSRNVEITESIQRSDIFDPSFSASRLISASTTDWLKVTREYLNHLTHILTQVLLNEAIINDKIFEVYDLTEQDKSMVLQKEGESIGGMPVCQEARAAYLSEESATKEFPLDGIREFIEGLTCCSLTDEERKAIEGAFPSLYQSNNGFEEFCIQHQVNPINVWYLFRESGVIPKQRQQTLAMEFLADLIRDILMEDEDGIIPLVPNAGEKILLERLERKFIEKGFTTAQFSSFDSLLGSPLESYLKGCFFGEFSERLNLFRHLPMTPFIWHLSSGPERGFDCYLIIYKWSRDRLLRLKSFYLEHRVRALENRRTDLADNEGAEAQTEKDRIGKQIREIAAFETKIDSLLADGYDPILDDGVGKNIAPLQKLGMLGSGYEVLNAGQLKKYLNADW